MTWIAEDNVKEYVRSFTPREKSDLKGMLEGVDPLAIDLLSRLIVFDPRKRISLEEIFNHPYFKEVRDPNMEKVKVQEISMDFEEEELTFGRLRELFVKEIQEYHPEL